MIPGDPMRFGALTGLPRVVGGLVLTLALVALLAACGNDEDEVDASDLEPTTTPDGGEEPWPPPTATPEPVSEADQAAQIDVETMAEEAGCDITPAIGVNDPWLTEVSPVWMRIGDYKVARSGPGPFQIHDSTWYTGQNTIAWHAESGDLIDEDLEITGRNLDSGTELTPSNVETTYQVPDGVIALAPVEFIERGCWQVSIGQIEVVAYVLSEEKRPDLRAALEYHQQVIPYDIPADCEAIDWAGPSIRQGLFAAYWLPDANVDIMSSSGLFFAGANELVVVTNDQDAVVTGNSTDNPAIRLRSEVRPGSGGLIQVQAADLVFPVPGCWEISIEVEGQTTEATVYVFPEECRREPGEELSSDCIVPD